MYIYNIIYSGGTHSPPPAHTKQKYIKKWDADVQHSPPPPPPIGHLPY